MRGVFVTGTGTEVGKTVVSAWIASRARAEGLRVGVFKPAASGLDEPGESDPELLRRASGSSQSDEQVSPYRFGPPVSPHLAAELAGTEVDVETLLRAFTKAATGSDFLVAEGVGGLLVPLRRDYLVRDLAAELELPLVVAASPGLGTINHALLTVEAARSVGLEVAAVVLTPWPEGPGGMELSNKETIARLGDVPVERLPGLDLADPRSWPPLPGSLTELLG